MLFVSVYRENFQGIDILRNRADVRQAAFLPYFPESHCQQIALSVRVTAQPSPGIIEIVIGHEDLLPVRTDHPCRCGQVCGGVAPGVEVLAAFQPPEKLSAVCFLLLVPWAVLRQLLR